MPLALQCIFGASDLGPITTLCCLIGDWPSYAPGQWVPFLSPRTSRRDYGACIGTRLQMTTPCQIKVILRPTVSRPVWSGIRP
jgi:hypothetical protein